MNKNFRRRVLALLGLLIVASVLIAALLALPQRLDAVHYGNGVWRTPDKTEVCPGDTIAFPITVAVEDAPAVARIVESWCRSDGICPMSLSTAQNIALVETYSVQTTARRKVPIGLTPGDWQLNHVSVTTTPRSSNAVAAWAVRITVLPPDRCKR